MNIIFTALVIGILFGISFVILRFIVHSTNPAAYSNVIFGSFTVGLILSFLLYSKLTTKVIKKYGFDEKYGSPKNTSNKEKETTTKKTNLPSSVLEDEEDSKWQE